jgi:hypothetical protein
MKTGFLRLITPFLSSNKTKDLNSSYVYHLLVTKKRFTLTKKEGGKKMDSYTRYTLGRQEEYGRTIMTPALEQEFEIIPTYSPSVRLMTMTNEAKKAVESLKRIQPGLTPFGKRLIETGRL